MIIQIAEGKFSINLCGLLGGEVQQNFITAFFTFKQILFPPLL